jgi:hypothetical protein
VVEMKKVILMGALAVVAIACGSAGEMIGEMLDSGVPDAGAQPGELMVQCDVVDGNFAFAEVAGPELPGPFIAYLCTEAEGGIPNTGGGGENETATCITSPPEVMADGRYRFNCTRGNASYSGSNISVPEPHYVRIVR